MGIYSNVESGTSAYRSRFHKSISYSKNYDCNFGQAIPVLEKFVLPGDIWRIGGNALIRFLPMVSPSMTSNKFKVRYFFVPLRLLEENAELIITGSTDGHFDKNKIIPEFENIFAGAIKTSHANCYKVAKHSLFDYLGLPVGDYESIKDNEIIPANYWKKAYYRCLWDYYLDENFGPHGTYETFEAMMENYDTYGADLKPLTVNMPKDYFTSSLPWQLKGNTPVLEVTGNATLQMNIGDLFVKGNTPLTQGVGINPTYSTEGVPPFMINSSDPDADTAVDYGNTNWQRLMNDSQEVQINNLGFTADQLRTMIAQTRIFERLARTGSRYTEYLRANFGTAPADGTLQRAQYLGGWSMPIVTTEVLQTAEDGSTPVGTMRGHGISNGGNRISTFYAKEFGIILGIAHVLPKIQYTQGIPREMTYKRRFDFFNPSLQHLSEQEVRNGELYVDFSDGKNDDTFGFQAYANELRSSVDKIVGDMRDGLKYWNQGIHFNSRPNLNYAFLNTDSYSDNFNQSFVQVQNKPCNIIVDFYNDLDVYRPMVRYSTPGLVDHL